MTNPSRIRIELRGGLGNQLFQASTAIALATRTGGELEFDISSYKSRGKRRYSLAPFPHGARIVSGSHNFTYRLKREFYKLLYSRAFRPAPNWRGPVFTEQSYSYDQRIEAISGDCYLRGYFQSWRYFEMVADKIRSIFNITNLVSQDTIARGQAIGPRVLAVHIRAGDFLNQSKSNAFHGVLPKDYYDRAIAYAMTERSFDSIICLSDNVDYARTVLSGHPAVQFMTGKTEYDDMYLMGLARSVIIANSTFGYWSAWLNTQPDVQVIAPNAWLSKSELEKIDIRDLYPPSWIRI